MPLHAYLYITRKYQMQNVKKKKALFFHGKIKIKGKTFILSDQRSASLGCKNSEDEETNHSPKAGSFKATCSLLIYKCDG